MSFWCGFLFAILFMRVANEVAKDNRWNKWTIDDFKIAQEAELKEFLLHKSDQAKAEKDAEDELRVEIRKEIEEELKKENK